MKLFSRQPKTPVEVTLRTIPENKSFQRLIPKNYKRRSGRNLKATRFYRTKKYVSLGLISLVVGFSLVLSGGVSSTGTTPANAAWTDFLCSYTDLSKTTPALDNWPGAVGLLVGGGTDLASTAGNGIKGSLKGGTTQSSADKIVSTYDKYTAPYPKGYPLTGYEYFGTAGQTWNTEHYKELGAACVSVLPTALNVVANLIFTLDQIIASIGLTIFGWAMSLNAFTPFLDSIKRVFLGVDGSSGLFHNMYLNFMPLVVFAGSLFMGYYGLVKKRSSEAVQAAIWMLAAATIGIVFLSNPVLIAGGINTGTTYVTTQVVDLLAGAGSSAASNSSTSHGICQLPDNADGAGWRMAQCSIWETFLYTPWANGQFGAAVNTEMNKDIKKQNAPSDLNTSANMSADVKPQSISIPNNSSFGPNSLLIDEQTCPKGSSCFTSNNIALVYLNAHVFNHDESVITPATAEGLTTVSNPNNYTDLHQQEVKAKTTANQAVVNTLINLQNTSGLTSTTSFTGDNWSGRLNIALLDLVAMFAAMIPIMTFTFSIIMLQLMLVFLFLMAPFFLTIGIYPGFGRRLTMTWFEMILGNSLKRVGNAFLLGTLMMMIQIVMGMGGAWIIQLMMIVLSCAGIMVYRKKILDGFQVRLGGNGGRGGAEMAQAGNKFFRHASGAVRDGMAFEGGFKNGVSSSLLTRNKFTRPLATAGKDVKKAIDKHNDPLTPIEAKAKKEQADRAKKIAQDNTMEQTSLDDMSLWQKQAEKTKEPVPRPTDPDKAAWLERAGVPMRDRVINKGRLTAQEERAATKVALDAKLQEIRNRPELINNPAAMKRVLAQAQWDDIENERHLDINDKAKLKEYTQRYDDEHSNYADTRLDTGEVNMAPILNPVSGGSPVQILNFDLDEVAIARGANEDEATIRLKELDRQNLMHEVESMVKELNGMNKLLSDIKEKRSLDGSYPIAGDFMEEKIKNESAILETRISEINTRLENWNNRPEETSVIEAPEVPTSTIRIEIPDVPGSRSPYGISTSSKESSDPSGQIVDIEIPEVPIRKQGPQNPLSKSE